ncbi:hypothetical protein [Carboxylicivirga linearis]|uniref:Uncharacterized protein n=1 Tax=Carboxylicivirga linearis TaxID=1628157 RepID=A0ABS5JT45_9BACT|nr:hypothetical protein [Carboxylicivirga linearis]MBS2097704.1 hypothetical protein [Carboxylicivirga linearis]
MIKRLRALSLFLFVLTSVSAQVTKFSDSPEVFLDEMNDKFKNVANKKAAKEFMDNFEVFWMNPETDDSLKQLVINTCNQLGKKRARPYPDYNIYLSTIMTFKNNGHDEISFKNWHNKVTSLLETPRYPLRNLNKFLKISEDLIATNTIFSTPAVSWKCSTNNYKYFYNNNKLAIEVGETNLICNSRNDSIIIYDTKGIFYPIDKIWKGDKGRVTWERSDFKPDMVYATFDDYEVEMDDPSFEVDSVQFYNKHYFDHPLEGKISNKVMAISSPSSTIYPKFITTKQRFTIEKIHPNIDYEGGFAQNGAKFMGAGTEENPAVITVSRNDTAFMTAKSLFFALRKDQILSNNTEISISLDTQNIYHPGLIFKYMADLNEIHLIRNGEGLALSPYFDTFHNISMDVELIKWKVGSQYLDLEMISGAAQNQAFFESLSYFREDFYNRLQGMDAIHPLQGLKNCSKYFHGRPFTATEYAQFMHLPESPIRQQVIQLSFYGFIEYNVNTDEIVIRQRLKDYLLFRLGQKDFDVIRFNSITPGEIANARLDLKNFDLNMNGVESISICDHQNVVFFPQNKEIILKENRNFVFSGAINAGMLNLFGNGFKFSYEDFRIDMSNIDSLRMKVLSGETDYFGQPLLKTVENTIANLSGYLQIDEADNKSGARRNSHFPILNSQIESYVYFNQPNIQNGAYKKEDFFFTLDPFEMDSINTLKPDNFNFGGEFQSNIFPTFRDSLTIRPDYSLGFTRDTPADGYPIYNNKAVFTNSIDLSNAGLKGNGVLEYVTTTSHSEEFTFLPDKVKGQAHKFTNEKRVEGTRYPDVQANYVSIEYLPEQEEIWAQSQEENFTMFNKEAQLKGRLKVTPYGSTGGGTFYMKSANLVSKEMDFSDHTVVADSSDFNLSNAEMGGVSFATTNLISNIDFETRQGTFSSRSGGSRVDFTDNRYISFISEFSWDMDLNDIYMGARGSKGNRFISTHRRQDSLSFYVPMARYDVELKTIFAEEVKQIDVGDANMIISDGLVTIREDAVIDPLDSVQIILQQDSAFTHVLYESHVNILGKYEYNAYGKYDYFNGEGKKLTLNMHNITLDKENKTFAEGKITEKDLFTFNSHFAFKGDIKLEAAFKDLNFNGGAQMLHRCSSGPQTYVRFDSRMDAKNVRIPINEETQSFEYSNIYKDFFITKDSTHVYSSFLESRKDYSDIPMLTGSGYLIYNDKEQSFDIAEEYKHANPDSTGNIIRFRETDCNIVAEGQIDMGIDLDEVKLKASGSLLDERDNNILSASTMLGIDFFFNQEALDKLYSSILNSSAKDSKVTKELFTKRMAEWIGKNNSEKIESERTGTGISEKLPEEIKQILLFSNIDFVWDSGERSFWADGEADLAYLNEYIVNKKVKVKAELMRKRSGNSLDMYIEFDENTWVYFTYKNNMMQTLSSNKEYNQIVQALKAEDRKQKGKPFTFIMSPESKKARFLKRFE